MDPVLYLSPENQLWILLIGAVVPLVGYVLNKKAPWVDETVKAVFLLALTAVTGVVYQVAVTGGDVVSEQTLQLVLSALVAALFAHGHLYKPAKVNTKLGAHERDVVRE